MCRVYPVEQQAVQEWREMERKTLCIYFHLMKEATPHFAYSRAFLNSSKHLTTSQDQGFGEILTSFGPDVVWEVSLFF